MVDLHVEIDLLHFQPTCGLEMQQIMWVENAKDQFPHVGPPPSSHHLKIEVGGCQLLAGAGAGAGWW